jgi:hypothetical protein
MEIEFDWPRGDRAMHARLMACIRYEGWRGKMAVSIGLRPRANGDGLELFAIPETKEDAVRWRAAQIVAGGGVLKDCRQCGNEFLTGNPDAGGKRARAIFCADKCRINYGNAKAKAAKERERTMTAQEEQAHAPLS